MRFDLRVPGKMIVRLPRAPGEAITGEQPLAARVLSQWPRSAEQQLIAALDIGSSKVSAMIARPATRDG